MVNIIVVFSNQKDAANMRSLLMRHGHSVVGVCTSGTSVFQMIDQMEGSDGIIVSGFRYQDMTCHELVMDIPDTYQMVVMASPGILNRIEENNIIKVAMPVKSYDFFNTLQELEMAIMRRRRRRKARPKAYTEAERAVLEQAKALLMELKEMTEPEAHRYLQKCSMDNSTGLVETAQMVIRIYT